MTRRQRMDTLRAELLRRYSRNDWRWAEVAGDIRELLAEGPIDGEDRAYRQRLRPGPKILLRVGRSQLRNQERDYE